MTHSNGPDHRVDEIFTHSDDSFDGAQMAQSLLRNPEIIATKQEDGWMHPKRILLATDLEDLNHTLPTAIQQARFHDAELLIAHVLPDSGSSLTPPSLLLDCHPTQHLRLMEEKLAQATRQAQSHGVTCENSLIHGKIPVAITHMANDWHADRVIVGSHGEKKLYLRILGSNAEKLFRISSVPVMAVGPHTRLRAETAHQTIRVLVPVSLNEGGAFLFRYAVLLGASDRLSATLLHVIEDSDDHNAASNGSAACLELMLARAGSMSWASVPNCVVRAGSVTKVILEEAAAGDYDFILLGNLSQSAFVPKFLPSSAFDVICKAPCPVLVIKEPMAIA